MKSTEESVMMAMDCMDRELLPFLPYILQDFWELGSDPETMIEIIRRFTAAGDSIKVLDLGCGKGAVSVRIAQRFHCICHGVDAIPEFIAYANIKASEYGVEHLCRFQMGDIRHWISSAGTYDVIILGSIGQVFGNHTETVAILKQYLTDDGIIIIDDWYVDESSTLQDEQIFTKREILRQISAAGMTLIGELQASSNKDLASEYDAEYLNISKRCGELADVYPDKADLFNNYIRRQKTEYDRLKTNVNCTTMVVRCN